MPRNVLTKEIASAPASSTARAIERCRSRWAKAGITAGASPFDCLHHSGRRPRVAAELDAAFLDVRAGDIDFQGVDPSAALKQARRLRTLPPTAR